MLHPIEKLYEPSTPLSSTALGIIYLRSPIAGKIKRFALWFSGGPVAGSGKFDVRVAGVSQFPLLADMLTLNDGNSWFDEIGSLNITVAEGTILLVDCRDLTGGSLVGPATFLMEVDDEVVYVTGAARSTDGTFASNSDAKVPTEKASKTYMDGLVVGLLDDRGAYDASGNVFPTTGGSGPAGAIKKGDIWNISVAGTLGGTAVHIGDWIRALVDTPGSTSANWAIIPKTGVGSLPSGGTTGQILAKISGTDYDDHWVDPPSNNPTLVGDVTGLGSANTVVGLIGRAIETIALPTFLKDDFPGSSLGAEWASPVVDTGVAFVVSGGNLTITGTNTGSGKAGHILGNTTFNMTERTIEWAVPDFTGIHASDQVILGIHPHGGGYTFGTNTVPDDFIGVILGPNSMIARIAGWLGAAVTGSGTFTPTHVRMRETAGHFYWDVIKAGGSGNWENVYDYNEAGGIDPYTAVSLVTQVVWDTGHTSSFPIDYVHTDYAISDTLQDGDFFVWDALHLRFKKVSASGFGIVPETTGAPVGAPSGVGAGFTQLKWDPASGTLYAWNGSIWKSQVF